MMVDIQVVKELKWRKKWRRLKCRRKMWGGLRWRKWRSY